MALPTSDRLAPSPPPTRAQARRRLAGVLMSVLSAIAVLWLAGGALPAPPTPTLASLAPWIERTGPITAVVVAVRGLALLALSWVSLTTGLALVASASPASMVAGVARRCALPTLRPLVGAALGVTVSVASFAPLATPVSAQPEPAAAVAPELVLLDPPASATGDPTTPPELVLLDPLVSPTSTAPPTTTAPPSTTSDTTPATPTAHDPGPAEAKPSGPPSTAAPAPPTAPTKDTTATSGKTTPTPPVDPAPTEARTPATLPSTTMGDEPSHATGFATSWTIAPGEHLWFVAEHTVFAVRGIDADLAEVADYHQLLIEANRSRLPIPADPDLVFAGMEVLLPPVPVR